MTGPYEKLGGEFPLYVLQFNRSGLNTSPETTAQLLDEVRGGKFNRIYLISHGWNNTFGDALSLYRDFFNRFMRLRAQYIASSEPYNPVFVGLHWPSIILLLPWEKGPRIAAEAGGDAVFDSLARVRDLIADELDSAHRTRFYELTGKARLSEVEAGGLAEILRPIYQSNALDTKDDVAADVTIDGMLAAWRSLADDADEAPNYSAHGRAKDRPKNQPQEVRAASATDFLDPRNAIRVTTVLMMKDRAGCIGRFGVAPLLAQLIPAAGTTPIRLIGHSYGARICLTALSSPALGSLRIASLLLLQPAVNQYCFANSVPGLGLGVPGGFVPALDRVGWPIYSTFSNRDAPLHTFFQLAARRIEDRGEIRFAAAGSSEFSALGGYGPDGMVPATASRDEQIHSAGERYVYDKNLKVLAMDGSAGEIKGHGDVRNDFTCWALLDQEIANVH